MNSAESFSHDYAEARGKFREAAAFAGGVLESVQRGGALFLRWCVCIGMSAATAAPPPTGDAQPSVGAISLASHAGAVLNSHLLQGGGTDDTAALQAVLDRASTGRPVHLIIDGTALVSGLNVYGNTTIECLNGAGLYLKDGAGRALIRNAHRSRETILDEHITVRGCFLNGNRHRQPHRYVKVGEIILPSHRESDKSWMAGLQFHGVSDLVLENVTLWNIRTFGAVIGNAQRIDIRNLIVDHGAPSDDVDLDYANVDGVHFFGPVRHVTIDGAKFRTSDDGLAFDSGYSDALATIRDQGPYVGHGPITDVTVNNVIFMNALQGMRFLSSKDRIDRVVINNVAGTIKGGWLATISNFMTPGSLGNIGSITFNNVNVTRTSEEARMSSGWGAYVRQEKSNKVMLDEFNEGIAPLFNINARIENLTINNFSTRVSDERPILRFGPNANIQMMTAELSLHDPEVRGVPIEMDAGSRIDHLSLLLHWQGMSQSEHGNPISSRGGVINQLNWIGTAPVVNGRPRTGLR